MELKLHSRLFNLAAAQIESKRPEVLGAHTQGYSKEIQQPWSFNSPGKSISLTPNESIVDFDIRGRKLSFGMNPGDLTVTLELDGSLKRTRKHKEVDSTTIRQSIELGGEFAANAKDGSGYNLILERMLLHDLQPDGPRLLLSWLLASSLTASIDDKKVPAKISIIPKRVTLKLGRPIIQAGFVSIPATLEQGK